MKCVPENCNLSTVVVSQISISPRFRSLINSVSTKEYQKFSLSLYKALPSPNDSGLPIALWSSEIHQRLHLLLPWRIRLSWLCTFRINYLWNLNHIGSFDVGSARHKAAATYTKQHTEQTQTDIHTSSGIRTHDPSVRSVENITCLRPRDNCGRPSSAYFIIPSFCRIWGFRSGGYEEYHLLGYDAV
jgi:hypothetical protein